MKKRKIYNRIAVLRKQKGMSRSELALKLDVNYQTIGNLERQEYNPGLDLAMRFSELFGLPLEQIFSYDPLPMIDNEKLLEIKNLNSSAQEASGPVNSGL